MKITTKTITAYEAEDGTIFETEHECRDHERKCREKLADELAIKCERFRNTDWYMPPTTFYAMNYTNTDWHTYNWYLPTSDDDVETLKEYIETVAQSGGGDTSEIVPCRYICVEISGDKDVWIHSNALTESIEYFKEFMKAFCIDVDAKLL